MRSGRAEGHVASEEEGVVEEVCVDRHDAYCWHCFCAGDKEEPGNCRNILVADVVFAEDGFRPLAL